jgi:uncharacterized protein (DUF169 family)
MKTLTEQTERLLELLNHDEMPMGIFFSDEKPDGFGPRAGEIFTREREAAGQIDWQKAFGNFSCIFKNIWLARKKRKAAWLSHEECGCMGGGYYSGLYAPYLETNVLFVSTGIPGTPIEGEHYMPSPESMRAFMKDCAPPQATKKYCVLKPLDQFDRDEKPLVVGFFARPEVLTGLVSLTAYTLGDHNAVASPFGAACTNLIGWPLVYEQRGLERAVLGGFDVSARKFMKTDEMTFAVPLRLYHKMLERVETSALTRHTWEGNRKKVMRSRRAWGEGEEK